jgi:hypothetical protein
MRGAIIRTFAALIMAGILMVIVIGAFIDMLSGFVW